MLKLMSLRSAPRPAPAAWAQAASASRAMRRISRRCRGRGTVGRATAARLTGGPEAQSLPRMPTILVVDDEPSVRRAVQRVLASAGMTVIESGSASDALAVIGGTQRID